MATTVSATGTSATGTSATGTSARPKAIVPLLPYQQQAVESTERFRWSCWSRQTGKSFAMSLRRILRGMERRRDQIMLSAGERQSRELMAKVRQHVRAMEIATEYTEQPLSGVEYKVLQVKLPGNVRIIGLPASPETARGFSGDVFLDEFAMHRDDRGIWASMFPTITRDRGEVDVASTPKGKKNMFYELAANEVFAKDVLTLPEAIEQGLPADAAELRAAMGDDELYRQEFLCEFVDEATAFLTY